MQIGSIGSEHDTHLHNVSNCVHESPDTDKKTGGAAYMGMQKAVDTVQLSYTNTEETMPEAGWFGRLSSRVSAGIKKIFTTFWQSGSVQNESAADSTENGMTHAEENIFAYSDEKGQQTAAAGGSPYFIPVENTKKADNLPQLVKNKIHEVTGFLAKHFSFSGRNGFGTGNKDTKDDLRRRSRYRENDIEMDCMLTDDSYLLDSYDRKGGYSRLSTKK
jgi:hypothetical protein